MPKGMPKRGDDQLLEGGGGGGGSGIASKIANTLGAAGAAGVVAGPIIHASKANELTKERKAEAAMKREAAAEIKRESRGVEKDQDYAKGGMTASKRADGIAKRGRTRGKMY